MLLIIAREMKKDKKRILYFIKVPPPITGATLMNQRVYESKLIRKAFHIRAIPISYMKKLDDMGKWQLGKFFKIISVYFKLFYELVFFRPRFVYFQISPHGYAFYRDLIFVSIIKLFRVKILFHLHGKGINKYVKNEFKKKLYIYAFKNSEIICLSPLLTYDIEDVYSGIIHIVNNGIKDIDSDLIKQENKNKKTIQILYLSNLIKSKGILDFIDSLTLLNMEDYQYNVAIVGAEADLSLIELQAILDKKKLSNKVTYHGPKYGNEKYMILNRSDILVFPTKMQHETFGLVLLEAMQFRVPVITTKVGAIPAIIDDGKTGYLVDKNAPHQIADKLKLLIENPGKRKAMGEAGRKKYEEKYTLAIFEQNMKNVFEEVIHTINAN